MRPHSEAGFTLLEVILALVLTGLLAAMAGTGVVSGFNAFIAARDNAHITQKANLALTRLTRELREATNVAGFNAVTPWLIYDGPQGLRAVALDADTIKLFDLPDGTTTLTAGDISSGGDILIDGVTGFTLNCFDGSNVWTTAQSVRRLSAIAFQLTIGRASLGGRASTFQNRVHLRNNNNYGGAVPPPTPPTQLDYCFINTVQEDRAAFPLLILLALLFLPLPALHRQRAARQQRLRLHDAQGAALLMVIVVLVVFSALAIVMLPMITTSQYTQLNQDTVSKTYYLAESGYRYAASQYLNAPTDTAKNTALEGLHNQTFTLSGTAGSFELEVFPYYGYVQTNPNNSTTLVIRVPGGIPTDLNPTTGRLLIGSTVYQYSGATLSDPDITFTMTAQVPNTPVDTSVFFAGQTSGVAQSVSMGGTITMASADSVQTFPSQNAEVVINGNIYKYERKVGGQLIGITDPEDATMPLLNLPPNTLVQLSKYVDLHSTGSHGSGDLASQRLLTYHVPLPNTENVVRRLGFHDTFEDLSHWTPNIFGTQGVQNIGGDNALRILGSEWELNLPKVSLAALDWSTTPIDLNWIHHRANNYLSYDAQVKIGFVGTPLPEEPAGREFTPAGSTIPTFFAAGLNFRLDSTSRLGHNTYGLSFLRGLNDPPHDRLDDHMVPIEEVPIIILWQQTNGGSNRTWLAWKQIGDLELESEDAESGGGAWTADGLWRISGDRSHIGSNSWYYGRDVDPSDYDTGTTNSGSLTSPSIDLPLCDYERLVLTFWSWHKTETQHPASHDLKTIEIRTTDDGGVTGSDWVELDRIAGDSSGWAQHEIDLNAYLGETVQILFYFDTVTDDDNNFEGWYIDDIRIAGDWPIQEATLALRLQEAPSLRFTSGGPYAIQPGDIIFQNTASAIVDAAPVITSGNWSSSTAAGHLVLKKLSGSFTLTQPFSVIGVGSVATVQEVRDRDNFIRVYYGSPAGCGTSNTNPLDNEKLASPRNPTNLIWPPADGEPYTAGDDAFTLLQWDTDKINSGVSSFARLNATQLRSNAGDLLTPNGPFGTTRPELGLHGMGRGAENVYFDDFGLSVTFDEIPVDVTSPIQE